MDRLEAATIISECFPPTSELDQIQFFVGRNARLLALSPTYKKIAEMNRAIPIGHNVRHVNSFSVFTDSPLSLFYLS